MNPDPTLARTLRDIGADLAACSGRRGTLTFLSYLFHPGFAVLLSYRLARLFFAWRLVPLARFMTFASRFLTGCDIHYRAEIAGGVTFPHGRGVVIGEGVRIAHRCSIFHSVTLGSSELKPGYPVLAEGVNVYPYSVISGPVEIGEYSRVGPTVHLTESVPSHTRVRAPKPQILRSSE